MLRKLRMFKPISRLRKKEPEFHLHNHDHGHDHDHEHMHEHGDGHYHSHPKADIIALEALKQNQLQVDRNRVCLKPKKYSWR